METYLPQAEGKGHAQIRTSLHGRGGGGGEGGREKLTTCCTKEEKATT